METRASPPPGTWPWLVYSYGEDDRNHEFCCNILGPSPIETYPDTISAFHNRDILCCSHGYLILYDYRNKVLSLTNSTTFDKIIPLPSLINNSENEIDTCRLVYSSSSLDDNDFTVVLFLENVPSLMWCRIGDAYWKEINYEEKLKKLQPQSSGIDYGTSFFTKAVVCDGKIYAKVCAGGRCYPEIWLIEIVEEENEKIALSKLSDFPLFNDAHSDFVAIHEFEACGDLYQVGFFWGGIRIVEILAIEIWKLNSGTFIWEPVYEVKDTAIFIGERYRLSCPSSISGFGRIYFLCTSGDDDNNYDRLYCYDIAEESVSIVLPCPDLPRPYSYPFWIMPQVLISCKDDAAKELRLLTLDENSTAELKGSSTEGKEKQFTDLELDVLEIVRNNFKEVDDYLKFRAVSRLCRSVAPPVKWLTSLPNSEPLLMFADKRQKYFKFVDANSSNISCPGASDANYLMRIPETLENTTIRYSNHGWLLLSKRRIICLFNPLTGAIICYKHNRLNNFFFSSRPSDYGCFLVSVSFLYELKVIVFTLSPGDEKWTRTELESNRTFEETHCGPVFFEDAFHFLHQDGNIGILRIDENSKHMNWEVSINMSWDVTYSIDQMFLVECGGELLAVLVLQGRRVQVYNLNQGAWKEVFTLGNYIIYLSRSSSFSIPTTSDLGNRIYFPSFSGSGIIFFSMKTEKWHSSTSPDESIDSYRLLLNSCWLKN